MTMSPRIESRVQESHLGAHGRKARPAVLLARFFEGLGPIPIHSEGSGSGVGSSPSHPWTRFSVTESNDVKQVVLKNGRDAVRATCAVCDTRKFRMGKLWASGPVNPEVNPIWWSHGDVLSSESSRYSRTLATEEASLSAPMKRLPSLRAARAALARASINGSQITCPGRAKRWAINARPALFNCHVRRSCAPSSAGGNSMTSSPGGSRKPGFP